MILSVAGCSEEPENEFLSPPPVITPQTWANVSRLKCTFQTARWCSQKECTDAKPAADVYWTPSDGTYERCGDGGCDKYKAQTTDSGSFRNLSLPENGSLARVTADNKIVEVLTLWDKVLIRHGHCSPG